jgi:hypothetical protein
MPRKTKDPTMNHWAVDAYRAAMRITPSPAARIELIRRIEELGLTEAAWRYALDTWTLNDYAKSNLTGMLDFANEHPGGAAGPTIRARKPADEVAVAPLKVAPEALATQLDWIAGTESTSEEEEYNLRRWNESQEGLFS